MLGRTDATPMIAVKDIDRARKFYEDKLGLKTKDEWGGEGVTLKSGDTLINVYRSEFAGTNKATSLTFQVDDVESKYRQLSERGLRFERAPQKLFWGYGAELRDPDGYLIYLWDERSMREIGGG